MPQSIQFLPDVRLNIATHTALEASHLGWTGKAHAIARYTPDARRLSDTTTLSVVARKRNRVCLQTSPFSTHIICK